VSTEKNTGDIRTIVCTSVIVIFLLLFLLPVVSSQSAYAGSVTVTDETGEVRQLYANSYALLIGVSDYSNGWEDLDQVPSELEKARNALVQHGFDVTMVADQTDMLELKYAIEDFIRRYGHNENNRLVFIYSGHGHTWSAGNQGYLVPSYQPDDGVGAPNDRPPRSVSVR